MLILETDEGALEMLLVAVDGSLVLLLEDSVRILDELPEDVTGNLELLAEVANGKLLLLPPDGFMFLVPLDSGFRSERCWMKESKLEKSSFECVCKR